jgi:putative restriction endonuclease
MGYCVFMLRPDSIYDDNPSEQYQFPKQYLGRAEQAVGDWVVYLEPRKVPASRGYFGIARVMQIIPDPKADGMYLALIEPGSYLDFARSVNFRDDTGGPIERGLLNDDGNLSGRAQAAVRPVSTPDFLRIIEAGLDEADPLLPRQETNPAPEGPTLPAGMDDEQTPFAFSVDRERVLQLTSRPVRDKAFRRLVLSAYKERCAVTGLKFINGGGRAEVNAAHIRPVEHDGPDILTNGIALSGTAHWMFDRGLISLSDDLDILISRQVNDIDSVRSFIRKEGRAATPERAVDRPRPDFLQWHRENCFKN